MHAPPLAILFAALSVASLGFFVLGWLGLASWFRQRSPASPDLPVSVLKPLKGCDPEMYDAFRSLCLQDYDCGFEIIFGVSGNDDPAIPYVERLKREFPAVSISLIVCPEQLGSNGKVSSLVQVLERARYPDVIISDSDIAVPPGYLTEVMSWFKLPDVGAVTCLYRARFGRSVWSRLEALGVLADFMPGALVARYLEGKVRFGLGATIAVKREAMSAIGGLKPLVNHLADDYELGSRVCDHGFRVVVAKSVVETSTPEYGFREFWRHQLRWGRTVRSSRPAGYAGIVVTFGLVWALLAAVFSQGATWSLLLLALIVVARLATVVAYGRTLQDPIASPVNWWLLPLRDVLSVGIWVSSIVGSRIEWRGEQFDLSHGRLRRLDEHE